MNKNPCSNQEIHALFEHGMTLYMERVEDQTDHFVDAFVREKVAYCYDIVTML